MAHSQGFLVIRREACKVYLEKPRVAKYADIPVRPLLADEILVKVAYAGICGTDISFFTGESDFIRQGLVKYPIRIGHEWSGI
jgi:L-iditol 2-dehydrogenase